MKKYLLIFFILFFLHACSSKTESKKNKVTLKVCSYNTHYFFKGYTALKRAILSLNCDIIALQEVLQKNKIDYAKKIAKLQGRFYGASKPYQYMNKKAQWLLSFISKYPITSISEKWIGHSRKALKVEVTVSEKTITFVTTHLIPFTWSKGNLFAANIRRSNMRLIELKNMVNWVGKNKTNTILLGDYNSIPIMGELGILDKSGYIDVYDKLGISNHGTFPLSSYIYRTAKKYLPVSKVIVFDYIFISKEFFVKKAYVVKLSASDHYPVIAELEFLSN